MARAVGGVPAAPAQGRSRAIGSTIQSNLGDIAMQHCQGALRACRRASKGHRAHPLAQAIALEVRRPAAPRRARPLALAAAALLAAGTAGPLMAQSWTGTISSDWFDPDNWQEGTVPAGGQAVIDTTAPNATEIAAGAATAAEVVVGSTGSGRLAIHSGGTLDSGYGVIGNGAGSNGLVSVDGAGAAWLVTGPDSPQIQIGSSGTGRLEVTNGGRVDAQQLLAVGALAAGDGTLVVDGAGSLATSGAVVVGYGGSGTLLLGGGGRIESTLGYLGNAAGSSGTATVSGPGTLWDTSALVVGSGGAGELHIQDGGAVEADVATFGALAGAQGEASVTTGGSLASAGQLIVGQAGIGSLAVDTGGSASANAIVLGETAGGEGTATVAGNASSLVAANGLTIGLSGTGALGVDTGATVQVGAVLLGANVGALGSLNLDGSGSLLTQAGGVDSFVVGHAGSGTLAIGNGAEVASDEGLVGNGAGGQGEVTVSGAGSAWNMTGNLFVGVGGTGSVDVTDGSVASASGILGRFAGASGTVTVGGAGANWNLGNSLEIGRAGEGTLLVEQGGTVSGIDGILGAEATGSGSALVRGAGSSWSTSVDLVVGSSGDGALTLADGGTVQVGGAMILADAAGSSGTLVLGAAAGDPAAAAGTLDAAAVELGAGSGTIVFNHTGSGYAFDAAIDGNGTLEQLAGTTILTGAGDAGGAANVAGGTLLVEGSLGNMTTTVHGGATLGGSGAIGGGVLVQDGGVLAPGSSAGTLTLGSLTLSSGAILDYELGQAGVVGGGVNDLIAIDGDLVLDGTLDVTDIGGFGAGVYRLMDYGGALTDNGLDLGLLPGGTDPQDLFLQTAIGGQVNLVNSAGMVLSFWDGADASGHNNGAVDGGDGAWNAADGNWTDAGGALNGLWDDGVFAVFGGSAGTVTVEGEQAIGGAQFMADYTLAAGTGGVLRVDDAATVIRVDPGVTAAIGTPIAGSGGLVKTDTGTLVLSAANTYAGGTRIDRGTLQVSSDANLGAASGGLRFDGGTLRNTAAFDSARDIALDAEGGVLQTDADLALSGTIGGAGALTKTGAGTLTLAGANTHAGGIRIEEGTLQVSADANLGAGSGAIAIDGGVLRNTAAFGSARSVTLGGAGGTFLVDADLGLSGPIAGTGQLTKSGAGTLTLTGEGAHTGGTMVQAGTLRLGDGGSAGSLAGDLGVAAGGRFVFDRGDDLAFGGELGGSGAIDKSGAGALVLGGDSGGFAGVVTVEAGRLQVDGTLGGTLAVQDGARLGGSGHAGAVSIADGGILSPGTSTGIGTLRLDSLALAEGAFLDYDLGQAGSVGGGANDLVSIDGDLVLDGTLDVTDIGGFGAGVYRLMAYGGALVDNGLELGDLPDGVAADDLFVQSAIAGRINLVSTAGATLGFWDGDAGPPDDGVVQGGDGTWGADGMRNWTDATGTANGTWTPGFAVFGGAAGTVTVEGEQSFTGMQLMSDYVLVAGDAGELRTDTAETVLRVDPGVTAEIAVDIVGEGGLVKADAGLLRLTGDNGYYGGTTLRGGVLEVASSGSLGAPAGALRFDGGTLRFAGDFDSTGAVLVGAGGGMIDDGGFNGILSGAIGGDGQLAKAGAGTLSLSGDGGAFSGTLAVQSGTLHVAGTLGGSLGIASGALLSGTGTLGSVDNAGTVAAGDSIGTLTLTGDYVHRAGAVLAVEIEPGGSADLLDVAGSATLEGGLVEVAKTPGQYAGGTRYTLIDAAGGLSGSFDAFEQDLPFLDLSLAYDANHAYLDVARSDVDFDIVCGDGSLNQCRVAGALDAIGERGDLTPAMEAVLNEVTTLTLEQAQAGFDRLTGEAHASFAGMMLEGHALYGRTVARRLAERREAVGAERLRGGAWVRAYGSGSELDGDGNAHGAHLELYGVAAGVDAWAGESWLVGASLNTLKVDADFRAGDGGEADAKNIALYTSVQGGRAYLDVATSYAWWDSEVSRLVQVGDIGHVASSDYGMHRFATHVEAGLNYQVAGGLLQPLLSAEWSLLSTEGFRETGADALGLVGGAHNVERTVAGLGLRWSGAFGGGAWRLAPTAQARWLHTFGDLHAEFDVALAGAPEAGFRSRGVTVPEDRALLGVGLQASRDALDLFVDLDYQAGDGFDAASFGAGMRWRW